MKAPVTASREHDQVLFPAHILDTLNPNHDDERFQQALIHCDKTLNSLRDHHLMDLIRERLDHQLKEGEVRGRARKEEPEKDGIPDTRNVTH